MELFPIPCHEVFFLPPPQVLLLQCQTSHYQDQVLCSPYRIAFDYMSFKFQNTCSDHRRRTSSGELLVRNTWEELSRRKKSKLRIQINFLIPAKKQSWGKISKLKKIYYISSGQIYGGGRNSYILETKKKFSH